MGKMQTIYHNGNGLLVQGIVMEQMGLRPGQSVTEAQIWEAITLNAASFAAEMELRRLAGEQNIPDMAELNRRLDRVIR